MTCIHISLIYFDWDIAACINSLAKFYLHNIDQCNSVRLGSSWISISLICSMPIPMQHMPI